MFTGAESIELQHTVPITSTNVIVQQYTVILDEKPNIKIALIGMYTVFEWILVIYTLQCQIEQADL